MLVEEIQILVAGFLLLIAENWMLLTNIFKFSALPLLVENSKPCAIFLK